MAVPTAEAAGQALNVKDAMPLPTLRSHSNRSLGPHRLLGLSWPQASVRRERKAGQAPKADRLVCEGRFSPPDLEKETEGGGTMYRGPPGSQERCNICMIRLSLHNCPVRWLLLTHSPIHSFPQIFLSTSQVLTLISSFYR